MTASNVRSEFAKSSNTSYMVDCQLHNLPLEPRNLKSAAMAAERRLVAEWSGGEGVFQRAVYIVGRSLVGLGTVLEHLVEASHA